MEGAAAAGGAGYVESAGGDAGQDGGGVMRWRCDAATTLCETAKARGAAAVAAGRGVRWCSDAGGGEVL